jgi:hypothetical protein
MMNTRNDEHEKVQHPKVKHELKKINKFIAGLINNYKKN